MYIIHRFATIQRPLPESYEKKSSAFDRKALDGNRNMPNYFFEEREF